MDRKKSAVSLGNAVLSERRAAGRDMRIRVHGGDFVAATDTQIDPFLKMYYDMTEEFCWGTVWSERPPNQPMTSSAATAIAPGTSASVTMASSQAVRLSR